MIYGNSGSDTIYSSYGTDTIYGGGSNVAYGGSGSLTADGNDSIYTDYGSHLIYGNQGNDSIYNSEEAATSYGGQGNDSIYNYYSSGVAYGNLGNDTIKGYYSNITAYGGQGNDLLSVTDSSLAKLVGGLGNDTFVLNSFDSSAGVNKDIGYNIIADLTTSDTLDLQDHNAALSTVAKWDAHSHFFTTGGTNLVVQFTSGSANTEKLILEGLGGQGFTSFTSLSAAGYHIVPTV